MFMAPMFGFREWKCRSCFLQLISGFVFFLQKGLLAADRARRSAPSPCVPREAALYRSHGIGEQRSALWAQARTRSGEQSFVLSKFCSSSPRDVAAATRSKCVWSNTCTSMVLSNWPLCHRHLKFTAVFSSLGEMSIGWTLLAECFF